MDNVREPETADTTNPFWLKRLGPGLITGAADDDPSGIGTYTQAGAQFGFSLLWTVLLTYPLMVAIQMISARIGRVTGRGLASNIRQFTPRWVAVLLVLLLVAANTINIAADLAAMGTSVRLVTGGPQQLYVVVIGVVSVVLQVFVPYERYAQILKWLTLVLFSYVAVALVVPIDWREVAVAIVHPQAMLSADYLTAVVAVFGTTISPYLFFWQASQEVEEMRAAPGDAPLKHVPQQAAAQFARISADTWTGMAVSNGIAFFIMLTAASTLHSHHVEIKTSADAARALAPIAGKWASHVFALGILGTGLLALPVLAGSAAYGMAGVFRWRSSLALRLVLAREFYAVIAVAILGGAAMTFFHFDPVKALYWSAVINGVAAVPVVIVLMLMGTNTRVMREFAVTGWLKAAGWAVAGIMAVAAAGTLLPG